MEVIYLVTGLIIGGIISFFFTKYHYEHEGKCLKNEVAKLRELNIGILRTMEEAGLIEWHRDNQGNITGMNIKLKSQSRVTERTIENKTLH